MPSVKHERHKFISLLNIIKKFLYFTETKNSRKYRPTEYSYQQPYRKAKSKTRKSHEKENILDSFQKFQAR